MAIPSRASASAPRGADSYQDIIRTSKKTVFCKPAIATALSCHPQQCQHTKELPHVQASPEISQDFRSKCEVSRSLQLLAVTAVRRGGWGIGIGIRMLHAGTCNKSEPCNQASHTRGRWLQNGRLLKRFRPLTASLLYTLL